MIISYEVNHCNRALLEGPHQYVGEKLELHDGDQLVQRSYRQQIIASIATTTKLQTKTAECNASP
ncbi:hypothetical protein [Photobacterium lipolyticum]|uniref:Uncharacterized protein n=1 Tax=Photobacterium lipolyticum TaxID=266810 RepID=A0A2T3MQQ7_9GAMM|nr:hypothetical protein [Photobacterium lipolyticum]PSV99577.1 hypothetical protein C9I89_21745 [Photobacterium lipolyticum]